jgi:hypothetical protein
MADLLKLIGNDDLKQVLDLINLVVTRPVAYWDSEAVTGSRPINTPVLLINSSGRRVAWAISRNGFVGYRQSSLTALVRTYTGLPEVWTCVSDELLARVDNALTVYISDLYSKDPE